MEIEALLRQDEAAILQEASPAVARLDHYRRDGEEVTRRRVEALVRHVARAVRTRDLEALRAHAAHVASARFEAGFDFSEVRAAFSAVEAAIRQRAVSRLPPEEQAWALGLVGTALAHARHALGMAFASLGPGAEPQPVDLTALFRGADAGPASRPADDLVFPV